MSEIFETMEELSGIGGVSGDEDAVRAAIAAKLQGVCELETDALGNLIAFKKGGAKPKNTLQFSAHMDEIGFVIKRIEDNGYLRFVCSGGIDSRIIHGKAVEIGQKRVYGVIGAKVGHRLDDKERETPVKVEDLLIDIGAENKEEAEKYVSIGDKAVFSSKFKKFGDGLILGRALDDRAGCAMLIEMAKSDLPYDCYFTFTVQEETGCIGGVTAAYRVNPDIGVAVEATTAGDIADTDPDKIICKLGGGPVISFKDTQTTYDGGLYRLGMKTAKKLGIPVQTKEGVKGGNESGSIQRSRNGVKVMAVSLPCRYLHSPACVIKESDVHDTVKLLSALVKELAEY